MSLCHRTPLLVWSCTSWSRMALHMLTQSKLGIQTGKELHSHLNFLPVRNLILKAENFRRTQNTQKLKHKKRQTKKKLHCSQSNWRAVNYIFEQSQIYQEENSKNYKVTSKFQPTQFATSWFSRILLFKNLFYAGFKCMQVKYSICNVYANIFYLWTQIQVLLTPSVVTDIMVIMVM